MKPKEVIDLFKNQPMEFAPGTKFNYNNSGFFLLGYIIEKIPARPMQEYIQENFFTPLGMTGSCYGSDIKIIKNRASGYQPGKDGVENSEYLSMLLALFRWLYSVDCRGSVQVEPGSSLLQACKKGDT